MTDFVRSSFSLAVGDLDLEPLDLDPATVLAGTPHAAMRVLDESPDGRIVRGVWQLSKGVVTDVEQDELFIVLCGAATVEIHGGPTLILEPGTVGVFERGARTTWHVHETLRKVFQITAPTSAHTAQRPL